MRITGSGGKFNELIFLFLVSYFLGVGMHGNAFLYFLYLIFQSQAMHFYNNNNKKEFFLGTFEHTVHTTRHY